MNTAIIAEYNPFHNAHKLHIEKTRRITACDNIIVLMSGNFTQRGEPAIFDKYTRTRQALTNGADMVLELPVEYATGAADVFAGRASEIIEKSGIISSLCFGSEVGDIKVLDDISAVFANESDEFKVILKKHMAEGLSYPSARACAAANALSEKYDRDTALELLSKPNNILAIEYLAALKRLNSGIKPYTIKRMNDYNSEELSGELSSAAAIRKSLSMGEIPKNTLPENTLGFYDNTDLPNIDRYSPILAYILRTMPFEALSDIADVTEGLENRLYKLSEGRTISELISAAKTSRYTYTKLQRAVLHMILGITKKMQAESPRYIRVLGVRREKKHLINELAANSSIPVITRVKENEDFLKNEIKAADIYHILTDGKAGTEYKEGIVVV